MLFKKNNFRFPLFEDDKVHIVPVFAITGKFHRESQDVSASWHFSVTRKKPAVFLLGLPFWFGGIGS